MYIITYVIVNIFVNINICIYIHLYIFTSWINILTFFLASILAFSRTWALPDLALALEVQQCPLTLEFSVGGRKEGSNCDPHLTGGEQAVKCRRSCSFL